MEKRKKSGKKEQRKKLKTEMEEGVRILLTKYVGTVLQMAKDKRDTDGGRPTGITPDDMQFAVVKVAEGPETLEPILTVAKNAVNGRAEQFVHLGKRDTKLGSHL